MLQFEDALTRLLSGVRPVAEVEQVDTMAARGRVLATTLVSGLNLPEEDRATMDGYALRCADVPRPGTSLPVSQRIPAGTVGHPLAAGSAARIFTGAPLPPGADAVVMQELCEHGEAGVVINHQPRPGEAVRRAGADIALGQEVLAAGCVLRAPQVGIAASVGLATLPVFRRLRVALFSTGDELAMPGEPLKPGGLYNSNRYTLRTLLEGLGCQVSDLGIVPDRLDATRAALRQAAAGHDLILTSGGVSMGEEDHVRPAVEAEGRIDLWQIAIKPGKPLAFGQVGQAAFIGLPGNPVSSFVTFLLLVRPFVLASQGLTEVLPRGMWLESAFEWPRPDRRREFLRARMDDAGRVVIHADQGASALMSTVWASGLVEVPPSTPIAAGQRVRFLPYAELLGEC